jgi:hypothetical protein
MNPVSIHEPVKLLAQVSDFSFFADDQVLTAGQLNRLIQYLDYQERATRAWLVGTGVVCGLTHRISGTSATLDPGCALTSDGDLLTISSAVKLTHLRAFPDANAKYKPLADIAPFAEIITSEEASGDSSANPLTEDALKNTVLALYLESFAKEPEFCTGDNCDNKGPVQNNKLRILLLPKAKVTPLPPGLPEIAESLPSIALARPKLTSGIVKLEGSNGLQAAITSAIGVTRRDLVDALSQLTSNERFKAAMADAGLESAPDWDTKLPGKTLDPAVEIKGLLLVYGFYRDFCQAYKEWRESLYCLQGICVPEPGAFPKHILLGETGRTDRCPRDIFRFPFFRASALASCHDALERTRLLWQRLIGLALAFKQTQAAPEVRLTPSAAYSRPLGERALPFYYGEGFSAPWNVGARLCCAPDEPLNYHRSPERAFASDLGELPFYRIEGHLGLTLADAEGAIKKLRSAHNLAFQILSIQIEDDPDRVVIPPIRFLDIESLFHQRVLDLKLRLQDVTSFASVVSDQTGKAPDTSVPKPQAAAVSKACGQLQTSAAAAKQAIPSQFSAFASEPNVLAFNNAVTKAVADGVEVNKLAYDFAKYSPVTPTDRLAQPEALSGFGHLFDVYKKRLAKVRQRSVFQKFISENPGLEHLGGVPAGGTFVLVYSASDDAEKRFVKADFCLPYYSYFDLTTLEEEEPPADVTVATPPYVFKPNPWTDIYQWTFTPITELYVDGKFNTLSNEISETHIQITKDVDAIVNAKIVGEILPMPRPTPKVEERPDLAGNRFFADAAGTIETNRMEFDRIQDQKRRGVGPPNADARLAELEGHNAQLLGKLIEMVATNMAKADRERVEVSAADQAMANVIKSNAVTLQSKEARTVFHKSLKQAMEQNTDSDSVKSHFAQFAKMF